MIDFIMNNVSMMWGVLPKECWILGQSFYNQLQYIFSAIQLGVPVLVFILCSVDMTRAVISQDEKGFKEAQNRSIKRIIIGVAIFFVPIFIDLLLGFAGMASGTCNLG